MITIYSLIDITETNVVGNRYFLSDDNWNFQRNQQRNWETVVQLLGLRFKTKTIYSPKRLDNCRPAAYGFGWQYGPISNISIWKCQCNYENNENIDLWKIREDFDKIPIITNLSESIIFSNNCFYSIGPELTNIIISKS